MITFSTDYISGKVAYLEKIRQMRRSLVILVNFSAILFCRITIVSSQYRIGNNSPVGYYEKKWQHFSTRMLVANLISEKNKIEIRKDCDKYSRFSRRDMRVQRCLEKIDRFSHLFFPAYQLKYST